MLSAEAERAQAREHLSRLVHEGGPGWHPYALDYAEGLVRGDPMVHAGLVAELEQQIGPDGTLAARRALEWFAKNRDTSNAYTLRPGVGAEVVAKPIRRKH